MTLPNFIIVGAYKAGTTSLYSYLAAHPQVYPCQIKEPRFFAFDSNNPAHLASNDHRFPIRSIQSYEQLFTEVQGELAIGEASPEYFGSVYAMDKIKRLLPDIKLIFCFRNPVDRLYSLYQMNSREGYDTREMLEACKPGGKAATENQYSPRMQLWLERFSRDQMSVMILEEMQQNPLGCIKAQYKFLGVDPGFEPNLTQKHNIGGVPKSKLAGQLFKGINSIRSQPMVRKFKHHLPGKLRSGFKSVKQSALKKADPMPDAMAEELREFYRDDVIKLEQLLGFDLSIWNVR